MNSTKINVERDINIHLEDKWVSRYYFVFLLLMYSLVYMTKNCFSAALADIKAEGIFTASEAGLITAVFYLVYTPGQIVGGFISDKYSPELLSKIGLIGGALSNAVIFFNQSYYVMLIAWTFNAIIQFALWPSTYKIITSQLCRSDKSNMIFFISMASTVGLLLSYVTAAFLPRWQYNFALSAVVLIVLCVVMHFYDKYIGRYMKKDYVTQNSPKSASHTYRGSDFSLFYKSGLVFILIPTLIRCLVGQGAKTLTPLMMLDTFGTNATEGNLLNTLIIISGICGTMLVKFVLYPRIIKNELSGFLAMFLMLVVLTAALIFVPTPSLMIAVMCGISLFATSASLFVSYFNAGFAKYGKNGTAAGITNAAASFGLVVLNYGVVKLSELYDWQAVRLLWLGLTVLATAFIVIVIMMNKKFKREESLSE